MNRRKPNSSVVSPAVSIIGKPESSTTRVGDNLSVTLTVQLKNEVSGYEPGHEIQDWLDAQVIAGNESSKTK